MFGNQQKSVFKYLPKAMRSSVKTRPKTATGQMKNHHRRNNTDLINNSKLENTRNLSKKRKPSLGVSCERGNCISMKSATNHNRTLHQRAKSLGATKYEAKRINKKPLFNSVTLNKMIVGDGDMTKCICTTKKVIHESKKCPFIGSGYPEYYKNENSKTTKNINVSLPNDGTDHQKYKSNQSITKVDVSIEVVNNDIVDDEFNY